MSDDEREREGDRECGEQRERVGIDRRGEHGLVRPNEEVDGPDVCARRLIAEERRECQRRARQRSRRLRIGEAPPFVNFDDRLRARAGRAIDVGPAMFVDRDEQQFAPPDARGGDLRRKLRVARGRSVSDVGDQHVARRERFGAEHRNVGAEGEERHARDQRPEQDRNQDGRDQRQAPAEAEVHRSPARNE